MKYPIGIQSFDRIRYLTIKDFDLDMRTYLLDFPNNEVRRGFLSLVASNYMKPEE